MDTNRAVTDRAIKIKRQVYTSDTDNYFTSILITVAMNI